MHIQVQVNKRHTLSVEAAEDGPIVITGCTTDLAVNNLFLHPFCPRRGTLRAHHLVPLANKAEEAFRALHLLHSESPFVAALVRYKKERLPLVLSEIEQPLRYDPQLVTQRLAGIRDCPGKAAQVLGTIITEIDASERNFFSTEKMLGTFHWLRSRDTSLLPFALASEEAVPSHAFGYLTPQRERCVLGIAQGIAYLPEDALPDASSTLASLCFGGICDESVRYINRAAAAQIMSASYARDIEWARNLIHALLADEQENQQHETRASFANSATITASTAAGALGLSGFATPLIGELGSTLLVFAASALGLGAYASRKNAQALSKPPTPSQAERRAAQRLLREQPPLVQSALAVVLTRFLDGISSASAHSPIVPSLDLLWRSDFAGASGLDPRVIPQTTVTSHQGTCTTSYFRENRTLRTSEDDSAETLDSELRQRLHEELASDYACLDNSAAADQHWNTLKAIQVANSFGRWAGLGEALSMPSLYHNLLSSAQHLRCNSAGRFTLIDVAFSDVLRHYNLGQSSQSEEELWDFCSLPLLFVDQLERCYSQRQAQKIALGILTL